MRRGGGWSTGVEPSLSAKILFATSEGTIKHLWLQGYLTAITFAGAPGTPFTRWMPDTRLTI